MAQIDDLILEKVKKFVEELENEGIKVEAAYLFGSHAKGSGNKWSDIDVAITSPDISEDRFDERIRLTKLAYAIDNRIEPVPFHPGVFVEEDPLAWEIMKNGEKVISKDF